MFIRRTTYLQLARRAAAYSDTYSEARTSDRRRCRLVLACQRYRRELAGQRAGHEAALARKDRRIARMQAELDEMHGLNSEAVVAGERWQQRRADKPWPRTEAAT